MVYANYSNAACEWCRRNWHWLQYLDSKLQVYPLFEMQLSNSPRDIVENMERFLINEPMEKMHPWYRSFKGTIEGGEKDRYKMTGILNKIDGNTLEIVELPVRTWTQTYKDILEDFLLGNEKNVPSISVIYNPKYVNSRITKNITPTLLSISLFH